MQHGLPEYPPPQGAGHCTRHTSLVWEVIMHSASSLALAGSTSSHEPCMQAFDQRPRLYRDHAQKWQPPHGNPGGHRPHPTISQQISGQCQMPRKSQTGDFPEQGKPYVEGQDLSLSQRAYDYANSQDACEDQGSGASSSKDRPSAASPTAGAACDDEFLASQSGDVGDEDFDFDETTQNFSK